MLARMRIEFVKMHGLGNDFLVFDAPPLAADKPIDAASLRALADRHTGVGFDQALMLGPPRDARHRALNGPAKDTTTYYRCMTPCPERPG